MIPHDMPTSRELVESVREWLERDVLTGTTGRLQFHTRVAINVLAMVERELAIVGLRIVVQHLKPVDDSADRTDQIVADTRAQQGSKIERFY